MPIDREDLLKVQHDVILAANEAETLNSGLEAVMRVLCEGLGWSAGEIYRVTEKDGAALESMDVFYLAQARDDEGHGREAFGELIGSAGEAVERMLTSARPVTVGGPAERARRRKRRKAPVAALFPITVDNRIFGAFAFLSESPIVLDEELESVMDGVGIQLGLLIRRWNLEARLALHATEEQRRIGYELHDTVGQQVVGIGLALRSLQEEMEGAGSSFSERISGVAEQLDRVSEQIRSIIDGLLPVQVEADGFREVIESLPSYCRRQYSIECTVDIQGDVRPADALAATNLVHIAREAIRNAIHHGAAEHVRVSVVGSAEQLVLMVEDDGSGFDESEGSMGGHGLDIMRYRCRAMSGTLAIDNRAQGGAVVTCTVPRTDETVGQSDELPP